MGVKATVPRNCAQCGAPFQARVDSIAKGYGNYCCRTCWFDSRKTRVMVPCQRCGVMFETIPAKVRDPLRGKFCGQACRYANRKEKGRTPLADRFWTKVDVRGPDECWPWKGRLSTVGYGRIDKGGHNGGALQSNRVAWELINGPIPDGLFALHRCDFRPCCNPSHLFLGTNQDNMDDMVSKGRQNRGETSPLTNLTNDDVRAIRRRKAAGERTCDLAREYGVHANTIGRIMNGTRWGHLE